MKTEQTRIYPDDLLYLDNLVWEKNKTQQPREQVTRADVIKDIFLKHKSDEKKA